MPLKLRAPRPGKTPYYYVQGTYLGIRVNRSTGASKRSVAGAILRKWERDIERGTFSDRPTTTFAGAAASYMKAGGERRFLTPLILHFRDMPAHDVDQQAVDNAAVKLLPLSSAATRNRQVYTPVSAVLRHVGIKLDLRRPKGAQGNAVRAWLWPEEAERLFIAAAKKDREFAVLLIVLCYTGMRLSDALRLQCRDVRLDEGFAFVTDTKNGEPRPVFLPAVAIAAVGSLSRGLEREGRVFRFRKNGHLYGLLAAAAAQAEITLPERSAFHLLRHTWATWMRRFAGVDTTGLVATGAWKDRKSAARYEHVVVSEEAMRAALLPAPKANVL